MKEATKITALEKVTTINEKLSGSIVVEKGQVKHDLSLVKNMVKEVKEEYGNLVLTDEQVGEGKEVRTGLNKVYDFLGNFRKEKVLEYKKPIEDFENEMKLLEKEIKDTSNFVKEQLDNFEKKEKENKKEKIMSYVNARKEELNIEFNLIFDGKWTNKTTAEKSYKKAIDEQIENHIKVVQAEEEKKKMIVEKKEYLEDLIQEKNDSSNLEEKIKYTELEYCLEFSLKEIKEIVSAEFESRIEKEIKFKELKLDKELEKAKELELKKEKESSKVEEVKIEVVKVEKKIEETPKQITPVKAKRTIEFNITVAQAKDMLDYFRDNEIEFKVM